jgi:hypothetical protein
MGRISIAVFVPKPGKEGELQQVIADRIPLLRRLGLVTGRPPISARAADGAILHISEWVDDAAIERAHHTPEVLALWKRFEDCSHFIPFTSLPESHEPFATFASLD